MVGVKLAEGSDEEADSGNTSDEMVGVGSSEVESEYSSDETVVVSEESIELEGRVSRGAPYMGGIGGMTYEDVRKDGEGQIGQDEFVK